MATSRLAIRAVKALGLSSIPSLVGPEDELQTFVKGAPVIDEGGSGYVGEAGTDPRAILGFTTEAGHNAAADGTENIRFVPALPHVVFEGTLDKASTLGTYLLLATDRFAEYGLTRDAAGIWYIDKDKVTGGTNTVVRVVGFKDPVGTNLARVYFIVLHEVTVYET